MNTRRPPTQPAPGGHRLAPEFLLDYATGTAPEPIAVLVASHVALSPASRTALSQLETLGGAFLETMHPASVKNGALEHVLARLDHQDAPTAPASTGKNSTLPSALRAYVPDGPEALTWRRRGWGLREAVLPCAEGSYQLSLLRIRPGRAIPRHAHRGPELTLVLEGGFTDQHGHYGRGDVCFADETMEHRPVADPDRECLCLAVTSGAVRFKGLLGLLLAPFVRN
jgi:putative transcriptional regulator